MSPALPTADCQFIQSVLIRVCLAAKAQLQINFQVGLFHRAVQIERRAAQSNTSVNLSEINPA